MARGPKNLTLFKHRHSRSRAVHGKANSCGSASCWDPHCHGVPWRNLLSGGSKESCAPAPRCNSTLPISANVDQLTLPKLITVVGRQRRMATTTNRSSGSPACSIAKSTHTHIANPRCHPLIYGYRPRRSECAMQMRRPRGRCLIPGCLSAEAARAKAALLLPHNESGIRKMSHG